MVEMIGGKLQKIDGEGNFTHRGVKKEREVEEQKHVLKSDNIIVCRTKIQ